MHLGGLWGAYWKQFLGLLGASGEPLGGLLRASWGLLGPLGPSWGPLGSLRQS